MLKFTPVPRFSLEALAEVVNMKIPDPRHRTCDLLL
jgi:hypothetical protein